jgi:hypothetical protein
VLYAEWRQRESLRRTRRLRHQLIAAVSVAAVLVFAFLALRPRETAGNVVAAAGGSLLRGTNPPAAIERNDRLCSGDVLLTGRGQFVRLRLAQGAVVDLEEQSRLKLEHRGGAPLLFLEKGRAGIQAAREVAPLCVRTEAGEFVFSAEASGEVWLARTSAVRWPEWLEPWKSAAEVLDPPGPPVTCVTVASGSVHVSGPGYRKTLARGERLLAAAGSEAQFVKAAAPPSRGGWQESLHVPEDRPLLGLARVQDLPELARRWGIGEKLKVPPATLETLRAAMGELAAGLAATEAAERAAKLGEGQRRLREVVQALDLREENRWLGRTLEGLAFYERGRALRALAGETARDEAQAAFQAAAMAFEEALTCAGASASSAGSVDFAGLPPAGQAGLLARFYLPAALYHQTCLAPAAVEDPLPRFEAAAQNLGRTIESLAARYGRALALAQAGRQQEAETAFQELAAIHLAGLSDAPRAYLNGLQHASCCEWARLAMAKGQAAQLERITQAFYSRFPLDGGGRAAGILMVLQLRVQGQEARRRLAGRDFEGAVSAFEDLFAVPEAARRLAPEEFWRLRLGYLEALVSAGHGRRAHALALDLEKSSVPPLSDSERAFFETLRDKAKLLFETEPPPGK